MDQIRRILTNIVPLTKDERDFEFHKVYGEVGASVIPLIDFDIADGNPIVINQTTTSDCTGAATSAMNTIFKTDENSIVNYLNKKGQDSSLNARAVLAAKYNLVPNAGQYLYLATNGQNGDINAQLLAILRYENGDYFDFLYQFSKICQVMGAPSAGGADLRSAMQALVSYGSINVNQ